MKFALLDETNDAEKYLSDDAYVCEEKHDGMRLQIVKTGAVVSAWTRNGIEWELPAEVRAVALASQYDFHVDGELMGDWFVAFDVLKFDGADVTAGEFVGRRGLLAFLPFVAVVSADTEQAKRFEFNKVMAARGEGVVFKRKDAAYTEGRSYGVKFKFYKTETFRVASIDISKGSCELERGGKSHGRCAFPFSGEWPKVGDLCEVRYDALTKAGKLLRPQWRGIRRDIGAEAVASALQ